MKPVACAVVLCLTGCAAQTTEPVVAPPPVGPLGATAESDPDERVLTVADAQAFVEKAEQELLKRWIASERAAWVKQTHITDDTAWLAAQAQEALMAYTAEAAAEALRYEQLTLPTAVKRKLKLIKLSLTLPAPRDAEKRAELARISAELDSMYGKGKVCFPKLAQAWKRLAKAKKAPEGGCLNLSQLKLILAKSGDYKTLLDAWIGWRKISVPMRRQFARYVELANDGARSLGFADLGQLWRSRYDLSPDAFEAEVDRLWGQVKPLYEQLHCLVRARLQERYGKDRVSESEPIPAHLLGNMWSQSWANIKDLLLPEKRAGSVDLEKVLKAKRVDEREMVRYGERFFTSLGLPKLPATFWQRSMFTKPEDREVVCHASAWDLDWEEDLRIKMCIRINDEDFSVIHHELGHNYYQHAYRHLPPLFRDSANSGFHEALGDTISLSVTPSYLVKIGLLKREPKDSLNPLMERALDKLAFLPFGVLIDKWRWEVFSGKATIDTYNERWWKLRRQYQGIKPPIERSEADFDPGAKYHIPANVSYTRYFLAAILQFQFHRSLCRVAGHQGPLHKCSIYGNKSAGARLKKMMEMGLSRPWPDALHALTGERQMDATAIVGYFEPLYSWLKEQNQGRKCGW